MNLPNPKYAAIYAISFIILALSACGGAEVNKDDAEEFDSALYTDVADGTEPEEGVAEMVRAERLLSGAKYPCHKERLELEPEFTRFEGFQHWDIYVADDYDVRVFVFLYGNQAEALVAMDGLQLSGDEQGLYRRMGVNGALLFIIEMDEEPDRQDEERWVVSNYLSALSGEE
jgi:hypothetical protein